uniref:RNA helicase n=1 Tax=Bactrocera dorsalis TaxID=27457 RepID=A0A034VB34_BACDO
MQLNLHYMKQENWNLLWPLHIGDLCIYKYADTYQRARILELPDVPNTAIIKVIKLTLKLIDEGSIISSVKSDELYVCADKFKDFPAQAINIRLTGVVPFDNERTWDTKATKTVQKWIMTDIKQNECVHVSINFTLIDTIWVNNVIVMEQLEQVGQYVYRVNLKRSLMEKNIADVGDSKKQGIREIAEELGLLAYGDESDMLSDSEGEFKSFSENDTSNLMKFSSNDNTAESEKLQQVERHATETQEVAESNSLIKIDDDNDNVEDWDAQLNDNANNAKEVSVQPLKFSKRVLRLRQRRSLLNHM